MTRLLHVIVLVLACGTAVCSRGEQRDTGASLYSPWANGPPADPGFFPLSVWWQAPTLSGRSGPYPSLAAAAAGAKVRVKSVGRLLGEAIKRIHHGDSISSLFV